MFERIAEIAAVPASPDDGDLIAICTRAAGAGFDTLLFSGFEPPVAEAASACALAAEHGLAVWLVVSPDRDGNPVCVAHAAPVVDPWLADDATALDPRGGARSAHPDPVHEPERHIAAWSGLIRAAVDAGMRGFVCRDADRLPPAFWSSVLEQAPAADERPLRWIAWTAGMPSTAVDALVGAGFDTIVASVAWWDGQGRWLAGEFEHATGAARLVFPVDPFAAAAQTPREHPLTVEQRLTIAAMTGDALLIPADLWLTEAGADLPIAATNARFAARRPAASAWENDQQRDRQRVHLRFASASDAPVTALIAMPHADLRACEQATIAFINPSPRHDASLDAGVVTGVLGGFNLSRAGEAEGSPSLDPCSRVDVPAGGVVLFHATRSPFIQRPVATGRRVLEAAVTQPRLAIEAITPCVEGGRFPVKRTAGETVRVEADLLIDGHEKLAAALLYRVAGDRTWREVAMEPMGNDRFVARFPTSRVGRHEYTIEAWHDTFGTYRDELDKKVQAGLDVALELIEGRQLVEIAVAEGRRKYLGDALRRLVMLSAALARVAVRQTTASATDRAAKLAVIGELLSSQVRADMRLADTRAFATRPDAVFPVDAERIEASFAAWYELFPRSLGNPPGSPATHHGTFADVIDRMPAIRAMGFDVLYFPPIHPIGRRNRKGRNNGLVAADDDPGSPYAIGAEEGGHDALHPQLGTFDDFRRMRDAALAHGLELALDFAIQCSPDHPWLKEHPGWFAWRPDGTIRYAENPPKKYEDIVNVDFYNGNGPQGATALWAALRDVVLLWCGEGVRIFRVDNPHTKPLPFWEWMIGEVRTRFPDVIFLAEAFTRPKVMYRLAKVGFSQSYTYFTWRDAKVELTDYLTELTGPSSRESLHATPRDFFRPNFFVNTPDINPVFLQRSGRAGFLIRAALAATLSGLWGVYSGFELCEATPVPGKEDYLDSEKYQLRAWDWQRPGNIVAEITTLNAIRRDNPALRTHLGVRFETVFDPNILYFVKATEDLGNVVVVAINLDPHGVHEADFEIPLWRWNRPDDATVQVTDLLDGHRFAWVGKVQRMRLDPGVNPYAIWRVTL